jgi:hypothetical protein
LILPLSRSARRSSIAARRALVDRYEARNRLVTARNHELLAGLDPSEELGQVGLGFSNFNRLGHGRLP